MKSAKTYGRPSSPAQIALCGDEPSSQTSGRSGPPGQRGEPRERMAVGEVVLE